MVPVITNQSTIETVQSSSNPHPCRAAGAEQEVPGGAGD
jgi:hypothetical protein